MSEKNITIRLETKDDYRAVENLTRESFWNVYRPGCMEHYVLHCYRDDPAFVPELDFVMERSGELIGQVIYVRSEIDCDDGRKVPIIYSISKHTHRDDILFSPIGKRNLSILDRLCVNYNLFPRMLVSKPELLRSVYIHFHAAVPHAPSRL